MRSKCIIEEIEDKKITSDFYGLDTFMKSS